MCHSQYGFIVYCIIGLSIACHYLGRLQLFYDWIPVNVIDHNLDIRWISYRDAKIWQISYLNSLTFLLSVYQIPWPCIFSPLGGDTHRVCNAWSDGPEFASCTGCVGVDMYQCCIKPRLNDATSWYNPHPTSKKVLFAMYSIIVNKRHKWRHVIKIKKIALKKKCMEIEHALFHATSCHIPVVPNWFIKSLVVSMQNCLWLRVPKILIGAFWKEQGIVS